MLFDEIDWEQSFRECQRPGPGRVPGSEESRAHWDAKAVHFGRKKKRSSYADQLLALMALAPGESVFDIGCGSGTLAIPLAEAGHPVVAVDFSSAMLSELERIANERGIMSRLQLFQRSWQEDWDDLPVADVAVSSRSFVVDDLREGISKLEAQGRRRAVLTCGAGNRPYRDLRILRAIGRTETTVAPPTELAAIVNYLFSEGRFPHISYIEYPSDWSMGTRKELIEAIYDQVEPEGAEKALLDEYLAAHIVQDERTGRWSTDRPRIDRWGVISWSLLAADEAHGVASSMLQPCIGAAA